MRRVVRLGWTLLIPVVSAAQQAAPPTFTHADTLRGSNTPERAWWDVTFYDLHVARESAPTAPSAAATGSPTACSDAGSRDADRPAGAARGRQHDAGRSPPCRFAATGTRSSSRRLAPQPPVLSRTSPSTTTASRVAAKRPPWDGGFIWQQRQPRATAGSRPPTRDSARSVWWPNKDYLARRAGQPAHRDHRARPDDRRLQRPAAQGDARTPTAPRPTSGSSPSPINNYDVDVNAGQLRALQRHSTRARAGPLDPGLLAAGLPPRRRASGSCSRPSR